MSNSISMIKEKKGASTTLMFFALIYFIDFTNPMCTDLKRNFCREEKWNWKNSQSEVITASGMSLTNNCIWTLIQISILELKHLKRIS